MSMLPVSGGAAKEEEIDPMLLLLMALTQLEQGRSVARRVCSVIADSPELADQLDPALLRLLATSRKLSLADYGYDGPSSAPPA